MKQDFIFGVDLDGVVAHYDEGIRKFVSEETGVPAETLLPRSEYGFEEWGLDRNRYLDLHHRAVTERALYTQLAVLPGAAETLRYLSDEGVHNRIITARLGQKGGHRAAVTDTVSWLDAMDIPYRSLNYVSNKPQVNADIYIDDSPDNIRALQADGKNVIIMHCSYNADMPGQRANNWSEVQELVMDAYGKWQSSDF